MKPDSRLLIWIGMLPFVSGLLLAGDEIIDEPIPERRIAATTLRWENDSFGGTDANYTNGTRLEFTLGSTIDRDRAFLNPVYRFFEDQEEIYGTFFFGQDLYTPRDITIAAFQPDDRPYVGWFYGGFRFGSVNHWEEDQRFHFIRDALDYTSLELSLGVVGPWSQGEEIQTWFHDLIGGQEPEGWDHQIGNEVVFDANFFQSLSFRVFEEPVAALSLDLEPFYNVRLGTVEVSGGAGGAAVLGLNHVLGATPRRLSYSGPLARTRNDSPWEVALFGTIEGRGVAWNTFLDGNVFADSHSVEKENFLVYSELGLLLRYHALVVSYTQVFSTREFENQGKNHEFGSVRVGLEFPF